MRRDTTRVAREDTKASRSMADTTKVHSKAATSLRSRTTAATPVIPTTDSKAATLLRSKRRKADTSLHRQDSKLLVPTRLEDMAGNRRRLTSHRPQGRSLAPPEQRRLPRPVRRTTHSLRPRMETCPSKGQRSGPYTIGPRDSACYSSAQGSLRENGSYGSRERVRQNFSRGAWDLVKKVASPGGDKGAEYDCA